MARDPQLSLTDVQWVLGHAHLTTTELYLTPTKDEVVAGGAGPPRPPGRRRDDPAPPPPAPGYDPQSLGVLFGRACDRVVKHVAAHTAGRRERDRRRRLSGAEQPAARTVSRPAGRACWPDTDADRWRTRSSADLPPFLAAASRRPSAGRRRGVIKLLRWLSTFPGETWQQRWLASGVEEHPGATWSQLAAGVAARARRGASYDAEDLSSGLLMLICGDVIRPGLAWMLTRTHRHLASCDGPHPRPGRVRPAARARRGRTGQLRAWTRRSPRPGSRPCWPARADASTRSPSATASSWSTPMRRVHARGGQKKVDFYLRLRALGIFPDDAPAHDPRLRARRRAAEHRGTGGPLPAALHDRCAT